MRKTTSALLAASIAGLLLIPGQANALPRGTRVRTYEGGLNFPVDMAWNPGTRTIYFTEKTGAIRVMKNGRLLSRPCARLDVNSDGERGALGIVLHPRFKRTRKLYVYYTNASPVVNKVARFKVRNGRCRAKRNIIRGIPSATNHNGGQLDFVGGKLFVSVGEAGDPSNAQNLGSRLGKILRYNPNGTVPGGNPFGPVWSYGHRNPFGLAHKPGTNKLYSTENGPDCDDELNLIKRGRNYGWGSGYTCGSPVGPDPKGPLRSWTPPVVPTDPWWYKGRMKRLSGALYMGDYGTGRLHRFNFNQRGTRLRGHRVVYDASGILDVSKGPGGWLYFLTGNAMMRIVPD